MKILLFLALASLSRAADLPAEMLLWPAGAPGSEGKDSLEVITTSQGGERNINNVHQPTIMPFLPAAGKSNGAAVVIAPGGGHKVLCSTHEGTNVARWLADHGTAAFVLKYRLAEEPGSTYTVDKDAVGDMHRAIRFVRSRAGEWKINPAAVGVMGFSAGGEVCAISSMHPDAPDSSAADPLDRPGDKPDFQALIYPGRSGRIVPTGDSPPAFLAASSNDRPDISEGLTKVYLDFKKAGVAVELHLYADGGHGFGYREATTGPVSHWIERFEEWLIDRKFAR